MANIDKQNRSNGVNFVSDVRHRFSICPSPSFSEMSAPIFGNVWVEGNYWWFSCLF